MADINQAAPDELSIQEMIPNVCHTIANNMLDTIRRGHESTGVPVGILLQIMWDYLPQILLELTQISIDNEPLEFIKERRIKINRGLIQLVSRMEKEPEVLEAWMARHAEIRKPVSKIIVPDKEIIT